MRRVIELDDAGLTLKQVLRSLATPRGAILRRGGRVVGRIAAIDEVDLEDEAWVRKPRQIERFAAARRRFEEGLGVPLEAVERRLGLAKRPRASGSRRRSSSSVRRRNIIVRH